MIKIVPVLLFSAPILLGCTHQQRVDVGNGIVTAAPGICMLGEAFATIEGEPGVTVLIGEFCEKILDTIGIGLASMHANTVPQRGFVSILFRYPSRGQALRCADGKPPQPLNLPGRDPQERVCDEYRAQVVQQVVLNLNSRK